MSCALIPWPSVIDASPELREQFAARLAVDLQFAGNRQAWMIWWYERSIE